MVAPRCLILLALSSLSFTGCAASLQDFHYCVVNKTRAEYSWYSSTSFSDRWNSGGDYAHGYKMGYYDASTGKGCVLPAVPPPCYWSTKYQCCEGQKHIQDWYRGYQCGVVAAQGSGYPAFHNVPLGPEAPVVNKSGCGMCYAPSGCLCADDPSLNEVPMVGPEQTGLAAAGAVPGYQPAFPLGLIGPVGSTFESSPAEPVRTVSAEQPVVR